MNRTPFKLELMPGACVTIIPYQDSDTPKFECECDRESVIKLEAEAQLRGMPMNSLIDELFREALDSGVLEVHLGEPTPKMGPRRKK